MQHDSVEFVISSETRLRILSFLSRGASTPTQLARSIEKHLSHISRALSELEKKELVTCQNPSYTKPRVYTLTTQGDRVLAEIHRYRARMTVL
jgi:DNA-binding transcriptional ArsR family regulator